MINATNVSLPPNKNSVRGITHVRNSAVVSSNALVASFASSSFVKLSKKSKEKPSLCSTPMMTSDYSRSAMVMDEMGRSNGSSNCKSGLGVKDACNSIGELQVKLENRGDNEEQWILWEFIDNLFFTNNMKSCINRFILECFLLRHVIVHCLPSYIYRAIFTTKFSIQMNNTYFLPQQLSVI